MSVKEKMGEVKKCPKCGREMVEADRLVGARLYWTIRLAKKGDIAGDKIVPFYCKNCGYVELYKEIKEWERKKLETANIASVGV